MGYVVDGIEVKTLYSFTFHYIAFTYSLNVDFYYYIYYYQKD